MIKIYSSWSEPAEKICTMAMAQMLPLQKTVAKLVEKLILMKVESALYFVEKLKKRGCSALVWLTRTTLAM